MPKCISLISRNVSRDSLLHKKNPQNTEIIWAFIIGVSPHAHPLLTCSIAAPLSERFALSFTQILLKLVRDLYCIAKSKRTSVSLTLIRMLSINKKDRKGEQRRESAIARTAKPRSRKEQKDDRILNCSTERSHRRENPFYLPLSIRLRDHAHCLCIFSFSTIFTLSIALSLCRARCFCIEFRVCIRTRCSDVVQRRELSICHSHKATAPYIIAEVTCFSAKLHFRRKRSWLSRSSSLFSFRSFSTIRIFAQFQYGISNEIQGTRRTIFDVRAVQSAARRRWQG